MAVAKPQRRTSWELPPPGHSSAPRKFFAAATVHVHRSRERQETAEGEDASAAMAALRLAFPLGQFPHAHPTQVPNRVQESGMKTPSGGWRHISEEDWLQDTLLISLALVAFRGKLPSGMQFFSHEEDSKLLGECLRLRDVQAPGTLSFPAKRVVSWLAQEEDKAPAPPISDAADRGSRHCRELFLAAEGQSRWLQPPQETLEAGVASPDPGEKKRDFNSKVNQRRMSVSSQTTAPT